MIIRKYKLFENKIEIEEELAKLLELAVDTDELDLVKFFVERGAVSEKVLDDATYNYEIFKYLLSKNMPLKFIRDNQLGNVDIQTTLIDFNKFDFIIKNKGFNRRLKINEKYKKAVDDYFKKNPSVEGLDWAKDDKELFLYLLKEGVDFKSLPKETLKEPEVQKALIDFGQDQFVYQQVGFSDELKNDPKYKDYVEMAGEFGKFNL